MHGIAGISVSVLGLLAARPVRADTVYQQDPNYPAPTKAYGAGPYQTFVSSNATPPAWNFVLPINSSQNLEQGYIFLGPRGSSEIQDGPTIFDQDGHLIWSGAVDGWQQTMVFTRMTYKSQSVLGMWQGAFNLNGYGDGYNLLLNSSYAVVANVTTNLGGVGADLHEFKLTSNDTALMTAYNATPYDLSSYGIDNGYILNCLAQEVDIATGEALFTWSAIDHVDPTTCYSPPGVTGSSEEPWDWFHMNSIEKGNGTYLISSRHCHAVYLVDGSSGEIIWRLNGMNSSFAMGNGSTFEWQHDARWRNAEETLISIFDNAGTSWESDEASARGLIVQLDYANMTATLVTELMPQNRTPSQSQGNVQAQENGNWMVGWGQTPFFGEYTHDGQALWGAQFGVGDVQTYRVHREQWNGYPAQPPALVIATNSSGTTAYCSWNGATEVRTWELLGSSDASTTSSISNSTKTGFETEINIPSSSNFTYYQVAARDQSGARLGFSSFVDASNNSTKPPTASQSSLSASASPTATGTSNTKSSASHTPQLSLFPALAGLMMCAWIFF